MTAAGDAAAAWTREHRVRAGAWDVRWREAGEGPPLVLVHGLGLSADFWWRNGPPLAAAGFRVLAPDLPGFGKTDGPPQLDVPAQAAAVAGWADAIGLGAAAYAGHSVSCQAVLELAAREPRRVTGLVLAAPTGAPARLRLVRQALGFVADPAFEPAALYPEVGAEYLRTGIGRWLRTWLAAGRHDALGAARRVRVPSLVVVGRHDPVVPRPFARELAEALGELVVLPRGAHAVVFDAAEDFNREVVRFLRMAVYPAAP